MIELFIWAFIAYGITNIIVWGSIFQPLRDFFKYLKNKTFFPLNSLGLFLDGLTSCVLCTSTWVGFFLGYFLYSPTCFYFYNYWMQYSYLFFDGMFAAGIVWTINTIVEFFEKK